MNPPFQLKSLLQSTFHFSGTQIVAQPTILGGYGLLRLSTKYTHAEIAEQINAANPSAALPVTTSTVAVWIHRTLRHVAAEHEAVTAADLQAEIDGMRAQYDDDNGKAAGTKRLRSSSIADPSFTRAKRLRSGKKEPRAVKLFAYDGKQETDDVVNLTVDDAKQASNVVSLAVNNETNAKTAPPKLQLTTPIGTQSWLDVDIEVAKPQAKKARTSTPSGTRRSFAELAVFVPGCKYLKPPLKAPASSRKTAQAPSSERKLPSIPRLRYVAPSPEKKRYLAHRDALRKASGSSQTREKPRPVSPLPEIGMGFGVQPLTDKEIQQILASRWGPLN